MITRKDVIRNGLASFLTFTVSSFPEILFAENCIKNAPFIEDCFSMKDRCAKYARLVAEKKFKKFFKPGPAWIFSEQNQSVKKISQEHWNDRHYNTW
ncbi:MAG: hypothetical protein ABFQ65_02085 [Nanoarchaeota archaeon]